MSAFRVRRPRLLGLSGFAAGFAAPWAGLRHMNRHPRLWRHAIWPVVCNLLLTALFVAGLAYAGVETFEWLQEKFPVGAWWVVLKVLTGLALVVILLGCTIAAWLLFQGILCGHFYGLLAREVELQLGMKPEEIREVPLWYQVADALLDVTTLGFVAMGCLALNLIPVIGSIAAMVIGGYFSCFVFGMDYFDYPQALRAVSRSAQRRFARRHRATTLGLGASVTLLSFVPILNSVLLTTAAAGAVLLHRRLEAESA